MRKEKRIVVIYLLIVFICIIDFDTVLSGAQRGVALLVNTVVPALFPFMVLTTLIVGNLSGTDIKILRPIRKICGLQAGTEIIFILGLLGGYPTGAASVYQGWKDGKFSTKQASYMISFCNNAGPAFIFGICGTFFDNGWCGWCLWSIQILSAIYVGRLIGEKQTHEFFHSKQCKIITLTTALETGIKNMSRICGWVVMSRIAISLMEEWVSIESGVPGVLLSGVMELTNGCMALDTISSPGARFVCASVILSFGGLCVALQSASVTNGISFGNYIPAKILQTICSAFLAIIMQAFLFTQEKQMPYSILASIALGLALIIITICVRYLKKRVDFRNKLVYNQI